MEPEKLTYMANQIARSFEPLGEAAAVTATAHHIRLFWDPRMRAELAVLAEEEDDCLSLVALRAAKALVEEQAV